MTQAKLLTVILNWRTPDMTLRAVKAALTAMELEAFAHALQAPVAVPVKDS